VSTAEQSDYSNPDPGTDPEAGADPSRSPSAARAVAESDETPLALMAVRDLAAFSLLLAIFGGADSWARATGLGLAEFVTAIFGALAGGLTAGMWHEWGHFIGARLAGGHSPLKPVQAFPQVFDFDYEGNSPKSFDWMSIGGNVGNWAAALFFVLALPLGSIGPDALVAGAVGFSVFTSLVEFPVIRKCRAGMPGIEALGTIPKDFVSRYLPYALGASLLTFAIL
jgi:hypothetical protein